MKVAQKKKSGATKHWGSVLSLGSAIAIMERSEKAAVRPQATVTAIPALRMSVGNLRSVRCLVGWRERRLTCEIDLNGGARRRRRFHRVLLIIRLLQGIDS